MGKETYRYNPETCKYEPVKFRFGIFFLNVTGLLVLATVLFGSMLFIQSRFFSTDQEFALREENSAYTKNMRRLSESLRSADAVLASLHNHDAEIHATIFPGSQ